MYVVYCIHSQLFAFEVAVRELYVVYISHTLTTCKVAKKVDWWLYIAYTLHTLTTTDPFFSSAYVVVHSIHIAYTHNKMNKN